MDPVDQSQAAPAPAAAAQGETQAETPVAAASAPAPAQAAPAPAHFTEPAAPAASSPPAGNLPQFTANPNSPYRATGGAAQGEPTQRLSIGRDVHYVRPNGEHATAKVTRVINSSCCNLTVFTDTDGVQRAESVCQFEPDTGTSRWPDRPGTWHWPERV